MSILEQVATTVCCGAKAYKSLLHSSV